MLNERWLPVPGYESFYDVSDLGRVRSLKARGRYRHLLLRVPRILKPSQDHTGYLTVILSVHNQRKRFTVHSLVARAFLGPYPDGKEVDHIDRDRKNPALTNLRYVTPDQNRQNSLPRTNHPRFSDEEVKDIRTQWNLGNSIMSIAKHYGIRRKTVADIVRRKSYRHVA